ncbi:hypothetical protein TNCV_3975201 [Trichonephila clavipes]|nr:hypothetical protein TNCV_3975201 [Trichonephila clavipes]
MDLNIKLQVQEERSIVKDIDGIQPFNEMTSFEDIFQEETRHLLKIKFLNNSLGTEDAVQEYLDDMEDAENYRDRYIKMCTK